MIQLLATPQDGEDDVYLDLKDSASVQLTMRVQDIRDFSARQGSFTQSFNLPFTETNNQFFEYYFDPENSSERYTAYQKVRVELSVDTIPVFKGYLKLNEVNQNKRLYKVTVFSELAELSRALGDKKLNELDEGFLNGYDHNFTLSNIADSWSGSLTTPNGKGSDIKYPFVNYGHGYTFGDGSANDVTQTAYVQDYHFRPWMRVKSLFDRIIQEAGFFYDSSFLDSDRFKKIYMSLSNTKEGTKALTFPYNLLLALCSDDSVVVTSGADPIVNTVTTKLFFCSSVSNIPDTNRQTYDSGNIWNDGTYELEVPRSGDWSFQVQVKFSIDPPIYASTNIFSGVRIKRNGNYILASNGNPLVVLTTVNFNNQTGLDNPYYVQGVVDVNVAANDVLEFEFALGAKDYQGGIDYRINILQSESYVQVVDQPKNGVTDIVGVRRNLPDMKQIDFLRGIAKIFNLIIEPDPIDPRKLYIEPYPDYIDGGSVIDWTKKIDLSKDVIIKPTHDFRKREFSLKYTSDDYYLAQWPIENGNRELNSYVYISNDELSEGEANNKVPFGVMPWTQFYDISKNSVTTYGIYATEDGVLKPCDFSPTLGYITQQFGQMTGINIADNDLQTGLNYNFYSFVSPYHLSGTNANNVIDVNNFPLNGNGANNDVWDLSFGVKSGFSTAISAPTTRTSFNDFWSRYISELYSDNSRIMVAYFNLDVVDIHNLRLNSNIFVKDSYWRINKISNYKIGEKKSTKVELVKIVTDSRLYEGCSLALDELTPTGLVKFSDGDNNGIVGNKECCESYGYDWKEAVTIIVGEEEVTLPAGCYWQDLPTSSGSGGDEPPKNREPVTGACCLPTDLCIETTSVNCQLLGGSYNGDFSTCEETQCVEPTGACCLPGGGCEVTTEDECIANEGTYQGDGTTCEGVEC